MAIIKLNWRARKILRHIVQSNSNGREVRRAQALLWLHHGENVSGVAKRLGWSRRAIYKLVTRYQSRSGEPVAQRVQDRIHPGRPADKREQVKELVLELLQQSPRDYGYHAMVWSSRILRRHMERHLRIDVSERTLRRALHELRYRYKRPRYVLARRSPTWRQAKGGLNVA